MLTRKLFKGFEFAKVGHFYLSGTPFEITSNGKTRDWENPTAIHLVTEEILNAECSTYLVTIGTEPTEENILYVGEYTNSLKERWFREHKKGKTWVSWHSDNLDDNLNLLLKKLNSTETLGKNWVTSVSNKEQLQGKMEALIEQISGTDDGKEISLWLTIDPYHVTRKADKKVNISRSIEQFFLEDPALVLPFNSKGRLSASGKTRAVADILQIMG
ncbi:hypothetical protein [Psychrosphaera aestuarii]|uniref:hypothetical protein n=1 Tax=Psychrosphaera aestuarii TaxID=1266052 RepID=UPI001B3237FC|nr:hypothetical protein [Psychrosphaera aestuarii]